MWISGESTIEIPSPQLVVLWKDSIRNVGCGGGAEGGRYHVVGGLGVCLGQSMVLGEWWLVRCCHCYCFGLAGFFVEVVVVVGVDFVEVVVVAAVAIVLGGD